MFAEAHEMSPCHLVYVFYLKSGTTDERGTGRQKCNCQKDQAKVALEMRMGKKERKREAALGNLLFLYADSRLQSPPLPVSEGTLNSGRQSSLTKTFQRYQMIYPAGCWSYVGFYEAAI